MTSAQPKVLSFQKAVGATIRRIREAYELRQEELAAMARSEWGLTWTRATVAAIETGKRELSPVEFLLLKPMLSVRYEDLFPDKQPILITPEAIVRSDFLKALFSPEFDHERILVEPEFKRSRAWIDEGLGILSSLQLKMSKFPKDAFFWRKLKQHAAGDAEQKAARKLGVEPVVIAVAAYNLWDRSLSDERDHRAKELTITSSAGRLQNIRGHVTRELLRELERVLKRRK